MQVGLRGKRQSIASAVFGEKGWGSTVLVQKKWVMKNNCLPLKNWQICWRSVHCTPQRENLPIHHKYTQLGSSEALKGLLILKNTYTCVRLPICQYSLKGSYHEKPNCSLIFWKIHISQYKCPILFQKKYYPCNYSCHTSIQTHHTDS